MARRQGCARARSRRRRRAATTPPPPDLAAPCRKAAVEGRRATTMRLFNGPSMLIVDELGYLPMPAEDANALFQVISQRYLRGSIILTTNGGVGKAHRFERRCAR
jgi:IstB-like ATP binding protein